MDVDVSVDEVALAQPFRVSHSTIRTAGIVRLRVRDGAHTGVGEVSAGPGLAHDNPAEVATEAQRLAGRLAPATPDDVAAELDLARAAGCPPVALMLVEMAFLDMMAVRARQSLSALLGLPEPPAIELWHTIGLGAPVPAGTDRLKVKLGGPQDVEILTQLAATHGRDVIVDVNRGWDETSWSVVRDRLRAVELTAVEDPVADPALLPEVRAVLGSTPVLLDEEMSDLAAVERATESADGANIKVTRFGGLLAARRALEFLRARGKRAMLGCFIEPPRAIAYAATLAGLATWTDLDGHLVLASSSPVDTLRLDTQGFGIARLVDGGRGGQVASPRAR